MPSSNMKKMKGSNKSVAFLHKGSRHYYEAFSAGLTRHTLQMMKRFENNAKIQEYGLAAVNDALAASSRGITNRKKGSLQYLLGLC